VAATTVRVREACESDRAFVLGIVPRLRAFGAVPLRTEAEHDGAEIRALERALASPSPERVLLVAELDGDEPAGIALAETATDYFTGERHGHLGILAVAAAAEGRGVGRALLDATERWARGRGFRLLTLNVFADNQRAREVYERAGFAPDTVRYAKLLDAAPGGAGHASTALAP
jgi:GNAT superfamily N-acetyltransferase